MRNTKLPYTKRNFLPLNWSKLITITIIIFSFFSHPLWAADLTGTGTNDDPYLIYNADDLQKVSSNVAAHYKLMADIDLKNVLVKSIGTLTIPFTGVFDGNGHIISNASITGGSWTGFFAVTDGNARIKNLCLNKLSVTVEGENGGGLVGYLKSGTIQNCAVIGTVTGGSNNNMGGIAGHVTGGAGAVITDCYIDVQVSGNKTIAAIVGAAVEKTTIERCFVKGSISSPERAGAATALTRNAESSFKGIAATDLQIINPGTGTGNNINRIIGEGTTGNFNQNIASETVVFVGTQEAIESGYSTKDGLTTNSADFKKTATYTAIGYKFGNDESNPWVIEEDQSYPRLWYMPENLNSNPNPDPDPDPDPDPVVVPGYNIIPYPKSLTPSDGNFVIQNNAKVIVPFDNLPLKKVATDFIEQLQQTSGRALQLLDAATNPQQDGIIFEVESSLHKEGYSLSITPNKVSIKSSTAVGAFYAVQSMYQLLPAAVYGKVLSAESDWQMKCCEINDEPKFSYRSMHLDVARHFMPIEVVKQYIDVLSMYKMNHFHWHLTDDQGWRIEIKKYPKLTEVGAVRSETMIGYTGIYDGKEHKGFYTQEQAKAIVAYAAERFITVVPEIEMPGHALAALASYPELSCGLEEKYEVAKSFGVFKQIFCPKETTFSFLEDVFKELFDIFPGKLYHVGGDECPTESWEKCPSCQALIKEKGLANEIALQGYFITRMEEFLNQNGKEIIGWDEILDGGVSPSATIMSWRGESGGIEAAKKSHNVIMTPWMYYYLDYYQAGEELEKEDYPSIGGFLFLEKVYNYNPVPSSLSTEEQKRIIGIQGNMWTEYVSTPERLMYQVFPRALAIAENAWTPVEQKNYTSFRTRVASNYPKLALKGVNASETFYNPIFHFEKNNVYPKNLRITLDYPEAEIRYTLDGSDPIASSPLYSATLTLPKGTIIKAAGFINGVMIGKISGIWFGDNTYFLPGRFENGDGTSSNPYQITNKHQLAEMKNALTSHFILMNDIDLTSELVTPTGGISSGKHFQGTFDGNGHTISNAKISGGGWIGFFGTVKNCTIKNLFLKDVEVNSSSDYAAGLVGYMLGGSITNCAVTGKVNSTLTNVAGLVGLTSESPVAISDCYVDVELSAMHTISSIVAVANSQTTVDRCIVKGSIASSNRASAGGAIVKANNCRFSGLIVSDLEIVKEGTSGSIGWFNRIIAENRIPATLNNNLADQSTVTFVNATGKTINSGLTTLDGLSKLTEELGLESTYSAIGYQFGQSAQSPWIMSENTPKLWFMKSDVSGNPSVIQPRINLFPNPCGDFIYLDGGKVDNIVVYSIEGHLLRMFHQPENSIDLSGLEKGVYLIDMTTNDFREQRKIVKN